MLGWEHRNLLPGVPAGVSTDIKEAIKHIQTLGPPRLSNHILQQLRAVPTLLGGGREQLPTSPAQLVDTFYESSTTTTEYLVGVIPSSHSTVASELSETELNASYISYPKRLAGNAAALVRSDGSHPVSASSSWVYRPWLFAHFQLHVFLFENATSSQVYVFCHHEPNWIRHPISHLKLEYLNAEWGRMQVVELFEETDLSLRTCCAFDPEEVVTPPTALSTATYPASGGEHA